MKNLLLLVSLFTLNAQAQTDSSILKNTTEKKSKWYDKVNIRGYAQVRYNRLFETNPNLECEQCDKSWGGDGGLFIRRARIIFFGQVHERVYFYIQPDFASAPSSNTLNFAQLRDAYVDLGLDKNNQSRIRFGQSKVPFGFENMQSSSNRLPLDRNDALNSALANERDMGVFYYWAPKKIRDLFSSLTSDGYKGSGDYGVFGFGVFNGQTANKPDRNRDLHVVGRLSYPFSIGDQIIEPSIQAYTGKYVVTKEQITPGVKVVQGNNYKDERIAASLILYPKPFGIQAEYNIGKGPEYNKITDSIEVQNLTGGYATFNYMIRAGKQLIYPFARVQYYNGGKKHELDARSYHVNEYELGIEWQPVKNFELVAMYTISERRFEDGLINNNLQKGRLLRLQAQVNF